MANRSVKQLKTKAKLKYSSAKQNTGILWSFEHFELPGGLGGALSCANPDEADPPGL